MAAAAVPSAAVVVRTEANIDVPVHIDVAIDIPVYSDVTVHVPIHVSVDVPVLIPVRVSVDIAARVAGFSGVVASIMHCGVVRSTVSRGVMSSGMSRRMMCSAMAAGMVPAAMTSSMSSTVSSASGERGARDDEQGRYCGDDRKLAAHGTVSSMLNPMRQLKSSLAEPKMNGELNVGNAIGIICNNPSA